MRAVGAQAGPWAGRALAGAVLRRQARTPEGYHRALLRVATRRLAPGLTPLPAWWWAISPLVRTRRLGLRLVLDLRDNLQRTLWLTGTYEPATLAFLRAELRRGDVFADVGAHVGVHALTAAARLRDLGGGTVLAFEPAPDSVAVLRRAARRNGLDVTAVPTALGAAAGEGRLGADPRYGDADAGVRSLHAVGGRAAVVPVATFDGWAEGAGLDRLDVVKIDVEGAELDVLRGMRASLARLRPRVVVLEVKAAVLERAGVDPAALHAFLRGAGYAPTGQVLNRNEVHRRVATR